MNERIFFDLGERFCVQRAENGQGFCKTSYAFDVKHGVWKPEDITEYPNFEELLLALFKEQFAKTDRSPVAVFDAVNAVMAQMKEEVIRVRDL